MKVGTYILWDGDKTSRKRGHPELSPIGKDDPRRAVAYLTCAVTQKQKHLITQLYFTKKLVAHNKLKKKRKEKQQYKQDDNHLVTNVGSLQGRQLFVGIDCKQ